ncbi:MAG: membrane protein insertion efficiency factor YidD [Proteobacteria bacterium]|nr:membrane protein insertion efficiency factor YidD [Pseudomonadota bacterium]
MTLAIRLYQVGLSPILGPGCRFYPSCSEYARISLAQYGPWRGSWLTLRRLARCHPLSRSGGLDLP